MGDPTSEGPTATEPPTVEQVLAGSASRQRPAVRPGRLFLAGLTGLLLGGTGGWFATWAGRPSLPPVPAERRGETQPWSALRPVVDFTRPDWQDALRPLSSNAFPFGCRIEGDRLVTTGPQGHFLFLPQRCDGPVALEFSGEILAGFPPGDLSVAWSATDPFAPDHGTPVRRILLQVGAYDNNLAMITDQEGTCLAAREHALQEGRSFRLRFEVDGRRLAVLQDGRPLVETETLLPCRNGWIGLYLYYPGKAVRDLQVAVRPLPALVGADLPGDAFLQAGLVVQAAEEYGRLTRSATGTAVVDEARYKLGLCLQRLGRAEEAETAWRSLTDGGLRTQAACQLAKVRLAAGAADEAVALLRQAYRSHPDGRRVIHACWAQMLHGSSITDAALDALLDLKAQDFAKDFILDEAAAHALGRKGRWLEILERYPHVRNTACTALLQLGREEELLRRYPEQAGPARSALLLLGRIEESLARVRHPLWQVGALLLAGRPEEAAAACNQAGTPSILATAASGDLPGLRALAAHPTLEHLAPQIALCADLLEHGPEALRTRPNLPVQLLLRLGESGRVLAGGEHHFWNLRQRLMQARLLDLTIEGRRDEARSLRALVVQPDFALGSGWLFRHLLLPLLEREDGDPEAPTRALATIHREHRLHFVGVLWHMGALIAGQEDEAAFRAQPAQGLVEPALAVSRALRAEYAGDRAAARIAWEEYLAIPLHRRLWGELWGDPVLDRYAAWRAGRLATPAPR